MKYRIIKSENFHEIENIMEEMKSLAEKRFAEEKYSAQASEYIAIFGEDAIKLFAEKYDVKIANKFAPAMKTDGKTTVKILPYVMGEYSYYISRDGANGCFVNFNNWDGIRTMLEVDGVILWPCSTKTATKGFMLFNDETDYRNYLPYDWEKNNPAPNNVGTISDKKMQAWKEWLIARKNAAEENKNQLEDKVAAFLRNIAAIPESECQRKDVREYQGEIIRNGLCYSWKIENGVVYDKIEVHYTTAWRDGKSRLDCFKEMCAGKYVAKL